RDMNTITTGSSYATINEVWEQFRNGQASLSKDDLSQVKTALVAQGESTTNLDDIIDNYDKIDINKDGTISPDELQTYTKSATSSGSASGGSASSGGASSAGKTLTKDSLVALSEKIASAGGTVPPSLEQLINNFSSIDADQDGIITLTELKTYTQAT